MILAGAEPRAPKGRAAFVLKPEKKPSENKRRLLGGGRKQKVTQVRRFRILWRICGPQKEEIAGRRSGGDQAAREGILLPFK